MEICVSFVDLLLGLLKNLTDKAFGFDYCLKEFISSLVRCHEIDADIVSQ